MHGFNDVPVAHDVTNILLRHDFNFFPWAHQENNDNNIVNKRKKNKQMLPYY